MITYTPQFNPTPWVDFVDTVRASGNNGFNARFQQIATEFVTLSQVLQAPPPSLEANMSGPSALGPILTLTNTAGGVNAAGAVDFNTFPPSSTGTYNPSSRIAAVDDGSWANDIVVFSNNPGAPNNGLVERARITSQGSLGIGTSAPRSVLEADVPAPAALGPRLTLTNTGGGVNSAAAVDFNTFPPSATGTYNPSSRIAAVDQGSWANDIVFSCNNAGAANNGLVERVRITSGGNVGIGTPAPQFLLDVSGVVHASSTSTSSDERFKTNVVPLVNALEKVATLRAVSFDWNGLYEALGRSTGRREIGVIAQDVEKVFPELVSTWNEERYRAVDYGRLTAVLIEAIKELKAQNDAFEARVNALEKSLGASSEGAQSRSPAPRHSARGVGHSGSSRGNHS
jgi:Chaperone of endosialidase